LKQTTTLFSLCLLFSLQTWAESGATATEAAAAGNTVVLESTAQATPVTEQSAVTSQPASNPVLDVTNAPQPIPADEINPLSHYLVAPGDALQISVWKEEGLQDQEYLVSPDGNIIFPLIGTINVAGKTTTQIKNLLATKLADYISEPSVTVKLMNNQGNTIFVIGKVTRPGQYFSARKIDVLQALSLAGGLTVYASESSISILRRNGTQTQVFPFDYSDVIKGEDLEQNILLQPGDTVTVP
jgi:polysaccharide export outer membrane protein